MYPKIPIIYCSRIVEYDHFYMDKNWVRKYIKSKNNDDGSYTDEMLDEDLRAAGL